MTKTHTSWQWQYGVRLPKGIEWRPGLNAPVVRDIAAKYRSDASAFLPGEQIAASFYLVRRRVTTVTTYGVAEACHE